MTEPGERLMMQLGQRAQQRWSAATELRVEQESSEPDPGLSDDALLDGVLERLAGAEEDDDEGHEEDADRSMQEPRWGVKIAVVLTLAASLALVWWGIEPTPSVALPRYHEVAFRTGQQYVRAASPATDGLPQVGPRTQIFWRLRPQVQRSTPVGLRIHASGAEERCVEVAGKRITETGAIELLGDQGDLLGLVPGKWTLTMLVGPESWPRQAEDPCARTEDGAWLRHVQSVASHEIQVIP